MAIHSSLVWAWAMSPGPMTTQGVPAAPRGPASVPKGTPRTSGRRPVAAAAASPSWHGWQKKKWYQGMHFTMDVF
jgi:hypothetical protein